MKSKIYLNEGWRFGAKILAAIALISSSCQVAWSNAPDRGSDKQIKSAEGAALTNAKAGKVNRSGMNGEANARVMRRLAGTQQQAGRGSPEDIREAEGSAVTNAKAFKAQEINIPATASPEHSNNPGGMMKPFLQR
jgi:hypothetical protein